MKNLRLVIFFALLAFVIVCFSSAIFAAAKNIGGGNITYTSKAMGSVTFKHSKHPDAVKNNCSACHPKIFKQKKFSSGVKMAAINKGKYCGVCHNGKKAFSVKTCAKCHKK
ncbi:MAG: cytochrome c3 family protein [Firmicutes bacterium]|nr:cytochrome c3 family protein [Bacillota bacterium]